MYNKYRGLFGNNNLELPASDVKPVAELASRISLSLFHTHVRCPCPFIYMQNDSSRMSQRCNMNIFGIWIQIYVLISLSCMSRSSLLTPPLSFPRDSRVSLDLFFPALKCVVLKCVLISRLICLASPFFRLQRDATRNCRCHVYSSSRGRN